MNFKIFLAIYLSLIMLNVGLLIFGSLMNDPNILKIATEAYKMILAAAIGALSTMLSKSEGKVNSSDRSVNL